MRSQKPKEIGELAEVKQLAVFEKQLSQGECVLPVFEKYNTMNEAEMPADAILDVIRAGMVTFSLHAEARVASFLGEGFYTIGPCGEELLASIGLLLRQTDPLALHYRHVAAQIARQLQRNPTDLDTVLLDRARGYVVSALDPVTGGAHCAIGGSKYDFLVTSTLASQTTPAVGRALAVTLAHHLNVPCLSPKDAVSFVSVGDGSVNNAHFLSGINLAHYAKYNGAKCPTVFAVSNNELCISLKGNRYLTRDFLKGLRMPVHIADGRNMLGVYAETKAAVDTARRTAGPVCLVYNNLPRRFGHAATDRQSAYLTSREITAAVEANPLAGACAQAVAAGLTTYPELSAQLTDIIARTRNAFEKAAAEPKITSRQEQLDRVSQPLVTLPTPPVSNGSLLLSPPDLTKEANTGLQVMRKHMNGVIDEILTANRNAVYLSEDGVHGGYYLVTDGLAAKHKTRVRDFPPDETSLVGAGVGYAQMGLVPIVEIPYAKYLDCGADIFFEAILMNWLSNGSQPNGMIIRLQGFDRGVFGGNFHTHNMLHIPPGLDVFCASNGLDYARLWRYAFAQAQKGRIVMSVDSTNLLNLRHVDGNDDLWRRPYPKDGEYMSYDQVTIYPPPQSDNNAQSSDSTTPPLAIVAYGNTVVTSLRARNMLARDHGIANVSIIDSPLLSSVSEGLRTALQNYSHVVFADVCKEGQHPLAGHITSLQSEGNLPRNWQCVGAQRTYNPLGTTLTFTSENDIIDACKRVLKRC